MSYAVPQAEIFLSFDQSPIAEADRLKALIIGPNAHLRRYSIAAEKAVIGLGAYNYLEDTPYEWPDKPAGAIIDPDYTKLFIDKARLKYFEDLANAGSTIKRVSGYRNRIRATSVSFAENGGYSRSSELLRDVKVGDRAVVTALVDDETSVVLDTKVIGVVGDTVAAGVDSATADENNKATQSASSSAMQVGGASNCITISASHASYNGLEDGDITETYTIRVMQSSVGGDLTTARLRVRSASGNDDADNVVPSEAGVPTAIGSRGLTVTFDVDALCLVDTTPGANDDDVPLEDLLAGQEFQVVVSQAFTEPTATSGGDYSGTTETTYVVEVVKGGDASSADSDEHPQISVTTTDGSDMSSAVTVTEDPQNLTNTLAAPVGSYGVTIEFDAVKLRKGDKYYISVTPATEGAMRTLVLANSLSEDITTDDDLSLQLYIEKNIEVTKNRYGYAPATNFEVAEDEFTVNAGIVAYDSSWKNNGVEVALPVEGGSMYVEYRAWIHKIKDATSISDISEIDTIEGGLTTDNPLKMAVVKSVTNSNGREVRFMGVSDPTDLEAWKDAIERLKKDQGFVHGIVPLTQDRDVLDLFVAHVNAYSTERYNKWRCLWVGVPDFKTKAIVDSGKTSDQEVAMCKILDNPDTALVAYVRVTVPASNAQFITNDVQAGDEFRTGYMTDGFDGVSYSTYIVDRVISEDELLLKTGPSAPVTIAQKFEIWRTLDAEAEKDEIVNYIGSFNNPKVRCIVSGQVGSGGTTMDSYYMAAALAGLRSGVAPHQSLTRVSISGFDDVTAVSNRFDDEQLNEIAAAGGWIMMESATGVIYTRHALTATSEDNLLLREEMVQANAADLAYQVKELIDERIGKTNATETMLDELDTEIRAWITSVKDLVISTSLGPQMREGSDLQELRIHTTQRDTVVVRVLAVVPVAANRIQVYLDVTATPPAAAA